MSIITIMIKPEDILTLNLEHKLKPKIKENIKKVILTNDYLDYSLSFISSNIIELDIKCKNIACDIDLSQTNIQKLNIDAEYNKIDILLPLKLKDLIIKNNHRFLHFNELKICEKFENLENLNIYNSKINNIIFPSNLKYLELTKCNIVRELNLVNTQIEILMIDDICFSDKLVLPNTLKKLNLNCINFNEEIEFSNNLLEFNFTSDKYNKPLILPQSLNILKMKLYDYKKKLNLFYTNIVNLHLQIRDYNNNIKLPKSLKVLSHNNLNLEFNDEIKLDDLSFINCFNNNNINIKNEFYNNNYLDNIIFLHFEEYNNIKVDKFKNIEILRIFCNNFNNPMTNLSQKLLWLQLNCKNFNQPLDLLPESLQILDVKFINYKHKFDDLPGSLQTLRINDFEYNLPLLNLPSSLQKLDIESLNEIKLNIPYNLETLIMTRNIQIKNINKKLKLINLTDNKLNIDNKILDNCVNIVMYIDDIVKLLPIYKNIKFDKPVNFIFRNIKNMFTYEELSEIFDI